MLWCSRKKVAHDLHKQKVMEHGLRKQNHILDALLLCITFVLVIFVSSSLCGCFAGANNSGNNPNNNPKYENALYIYMCGSTLETKNAVATNCLNEILSAKVPANTAIVIETGGTRKWRGHDIPNDLLARYVVKSGQLVEIERVANANATSTNMGDTKTFSSYLQFCNENYSAKNTTLLFWNHGAGSVKGVCLDENHSMDGLTTAEMNTALDETDSHFDNVCFDACLMANFETARVLSEHANTMIASQELEPTAGWDYTNLIENLGKSNFADGVLSSYSQECEERGKNLYTLSTMDLTKFSSLEATFEAFCESALISKAESDANRLQDISQVATSTMSFGEHDTKSNIIDLGLFSQNLGFDNLSQAISACTKTANGEERKDATGLSIFFPLSGNTTLKEYLQSETNETYAQFLGKNFASAQAQNASTIKFSDEGSIDGTSLNFKVSPASTSKVRNVVYDIYQLDAEGQTRCLGFDNDIQKHSDGAYSIDFTGNWVALNGHVLTCDPLDTLGDTTIFSSPVKLNGIRGDLRFTHNSKTKAYSLQGFVADELSGTHGRLEDIKDGDTITILAERFINSDSLDTEFFDVESFEVDDDLELSTVTLPDGRYQIYAIVTDIYGNEFLTRDFIVRIKDGSVVSAEVL